MRILKVLAASALLAGCLQAVDLLTTTAGPLNVRLQQPAIGFYAQFGPEYIKEHGSPVTLPVSLRNSGANRLRGTVRLQMPERWRAEPSAAVPFDLAPRGRLSLHFAVYAGEGVHNAHYPVYAIAEFEDQGQKQTARVAIILEPRFADPPRANPGIEWKLVDPPASGAMGLWRLPVRRTLTQAAAEEGPLEAWKRTPRAEAKETGLETFEMSPTIQYGVRIQRGQAREGLSIQLGPRTPALRERVQMAMVEYPFRLPKAPSIRLRFATAVGDSKEAGRSATFNVRVIDFDAPQGAEGTAVYEHPSASRVWEEADVDLSRFAGRNVRIQLQSRNGKGNGSVESYWAEPTLVCGKVAEAPAFPPPAAANFKTVGTLDANGARYEVRVWLGQRGLLDGAIGFVSGDRKLMFNGFRVRVLGDPLELSRSTSNLIDVRQEQANGRLRVTHKFQSWAGPFDLVSQLWVESGALRVSFALENQPAPRPWFHVHLEKVALGPWSDRANRVYCGVGNVIQNPEAFELAFGGQSLASSFVGFDFANGVSLVQGVDSPPARLAVDPQEKIYTLDTPLNQTMTLILSKDVWQAVKVWRNVNGLRPSAGVPKLAGRFVFDLWNGAYGASAKSLQTAFRYGLTDAAVIWHRWQRWGYDVSLPDVYPPNPQYGTMEDFVKLVAACRERGVLFAPHDNYIDFYPESEGFSYSNIAFHSDGSPVKAWLNAPRDAQAYRVRSDKVLPFVQRNLRLIKDGFAPTAYFLDVWSSLAPYDYWTEDGQYFSGLQTRQAWRDGFAWIRDHLGDQAPQISEAGHDQLIGWLDGGSVQHARVAPPPDPIWSLRVIAVRSTDAERIPWFDAAHHDRFIYSGAGYAARYASGQDQRLHGIYSDDYISDEVLTGHPGMVSEAFSRDVVRKYWLLHDYSRGLALRSIDALEFADNNLHHQSVRWDNGAQVHVNRGAGDWKAGDHVLPEFGYYARVPAQNGQVESAIERRDGAVVEWSKSPGFLYVNARPTGGSSPREGPGPQVERAAPVNSTGKPVDFGAVATNGAFRLDQNGDTLQLTPLPSSGSFSVRLRWSALPWKLAEPSRVEAIDGNGAVLRQVAIQREAGDVLLQCEAGAFGYRFR